MARGTKYRLALAIGSAESRGSGRTTYCPGAWDRFITFDIQTVELTLRMGDDFVGEMEIEIARHSTWLGSFFLLLGCLRSAGRSD